MLHINVNCFTNSVVFAALTWDGKELDVKDNDFYAPKKRAALLPEELISLLEDSSKDLPILLQTRSAQEIEHFVLNLLMHHKQEKAHTKSHSKKTHFSRRLAKLFTPILQARLQETPPSDTKALFFFSREDTSTPDNLRKKFKEKLKDIAFLKTKHLLINPFGSDRNGQMGSVYRKILSLRRSYEKDYNLFLHGMSEANEVITLFSKMLAQVLHPNRSFKRFKFLRWLMPDTPLENIVQFLAKNEEILRTDLRRFDSHFQEELLCVDGNLLNSDPDESAHSMCFENTNISSDVTQVVLKILKNIPGLSQASAVRYAKKVDELAKQAYNYKDIGHFFVIAIPKARVNNPATCPVYECLPYGRPAHGLTTPLKFLEQMQNGMVVKLPHPFNNLDYSVQMRLLTSCLTPENGIRMFRLGGQQSAQTRDLLKSKVQQIVQEIIQELNTPPSRWSSLFTPVAQTIYNYASYFGRFFWHT